MSNGEKGKEVVVTTTADMDLVERLVSNPDVDVEKLQKVLDMQEHAMDKAAQRDFNAAMVVAQKNMPIVGKDKNNTQTKSKYSSYEAILKATQPVYTAAGFSVSFYEEDAKADGEIRVCADIMHEGGCTVKRHIDIPIDNAGIAGKVNKTATHAKGSSISYGRSYLIKMIFNIPTGDDDDGNGAGCQYITEDQENELLAMVDDNKLNANDKYMAQLLKYLKVDSLDLLPAKDFKKAKVAINAAIKSQEKK
jgi:hypothetical protein